MIQKIQPIPILLIAKQAVCCVSHSIKKNKDDIMDEIDVKQKAIDKLRKSAMQWHESKIDKPVHNEIVIESDDKNTEQELLLITEIKQAVIDSKLDRKSVFLTGLAEQEAKIQRNVDATKLPEIIKNLAKKDEVKDKIREITKKYGLNGKTYHYLWGIEE